MIYNSTAAVAAIMLMAGSLLVQIIGLMIFASASVIKYDFDSGATKIKTIVTCK